MKHSFKQMALAAMMTLAGFAQRAVAADVPRPEYPRPQFERAEWLNLNGTWTYAFDFGRSGDLTTYIFSPLTHATFTQSG